MRRSLLFARRVAMELLRDPLSYIFCIGTPTGLMLVFYIIYMSVPEEGRANVKIFRPDMLTPGIAFFGFAFVMLLATLIISRDRSTAFLDRLRATPMRTADFLVGYAVPLLVLGLVQCLLTLIVGAILGALAGAPLTFWGVLRSIPALLPGLLFFIGCGMSFGSLLSEVSAPGVSSILITMSGLMGGIWMPLADMPKLEKVFACFPFMHMVRLGQGAMLGDTKDIGLHIGISLAYTAVVIALPLWLFPRALKRGK